MKRVVAVAALLACSGVLASADNLPYTPESFVQAMETLRNSLQQKGDSALHGLPESWQIRAEPRDYSISSKPLRDLAEDDSPDKDRARIATAWVDEVEGQVRAYSSQGGRVEPAPTEALLKILARPEFADVAPPNAWDRLVQAIQAGVQRFFQKLLEFAEQHPTESKILFWVLLSGSIVGLAIGLLRLLVAKRATPLRLEFQGSTEPVRPWQEWLVLAQQASERGDHKEAIRCGYWAGVMRLQADGALPVELTNTPRERLRLLQRLNQREPLGAITNALERYWYAGQGISAEELRGFFQQLEALECKAA